MTKITELTTKVTNGGASERGRLSADEYNTLLTTVQSHEESIASLEESTIKNCGYFSTLEALQQAYPKAGAGSKAYVGASYPYAIYLWDDSALAWVDSGATGGEENVELGDYYTKEVVNEKVAELESEVEVISGESIAYSGKISFITPNIGISIEDIVAIEITENLATDYCYLYLVPTSGTTPFINLITIPAGFVGTKMAKISSIKKNEITLTRYMVFAPNNTISGSLKIMRPNTLLWESIFSIKDTHQNIVEQLNDVSCIANKNETEISKLESVVKGEKNSFSSVGSYIFTPKAGIAVGDAVELTITGNLATGYSQLYLIPASAYSPYINLWDIPTGFVGTKKIDIESIVKDGVSLNRLFVRAYDNTLSGEIEIRRRQGSFDFRISAIEKKYSNIIMVGKDVGDDYEEIQAAIDSITDDSPNKRYTIIVKPGIYGRISQIDSGRIIRYMSIIGLDKENCKVISDTGNYFTPAFEAYMDGSVENISFVMNAQDSTRIPNETLNYAYAMHSDWEGVRKTYFRNCHFESNSGPAIGIGAHNDVGLYFEDCDFLRLPYIGEDHGAVFMHTISGNVPNQVYSFRNCVAINKLSEIAVGFRFRKLANTIEGNYRLIVQNCGSFSASANSAYIDAVLDYMSFGNNCDNLNAW